MARWYCVRDWFCNELLTSLRQCWTYGKACVLGPVGSPTRGLVIKEAERTYVTAKGLDYWVCFLVVAFGLACGPLLWGRLAALANRLAQAMFKPSEMRIQTYVDDTVLALAVKSVRERDRLIVLCLLLWVVLGFKLAWHKGQRGQTVEWIGAEIPTGRDSQADFFVKVRLTKECKPDRSFGRVIQTERCGIVKVGVAGGGQMFLGCFIDSQGPAVCCLLVGGHHRRQEHQSIFGDHQEAAEGRFLYAGCITRSSGSKI